MSRVFTRPRYQKLRLFDTWTLRYGITWRIKQQIPMAFLAIIDSLICIATLGFISSGWALDWGLARSRNESRKKLKEHLDWMEAEVGPTSEEDYEDARQAFKSLEDS